MSAPKKHWLWIQNTDGKEDAVLTMVFLLFVVILLKLALTGVQITFGHWTWNVGALDIGLVTITWPSLLAAYLARRNKWGAPKESAPSAQEVKSP